MSTPFPRWQEALTKADNDAARHALVTEVSQWRAAHLIDVVGQRESAYALAKLYQGLGDGAAALREAQGLLSLCRTPPMCGDAELDVATTLVGSLGGKVPSRKSLRPTPRTRANPPAKSAGPRSGTPVERAMALGRDGDYSAAFRLLKGKGGPQVFAARMWLDLTRAMAEPQEQREKRLRAVINRLEQGLPRAARPAAAATPARPAPEPKGRLGALLGRGLPTRRPAMLRVVHRFIDDNPGRADAVAAAALLDHFEDNGAEAPAPWLAGLVGRATGGSETAAALTTLADGGSVAVQIYQEPPFEALVDQWKLASKAGYRFVDLRRGVMRGEPDDRRLWTLRLATDAGEGLIALGPDRADAYDEAMAVEIAKRLTSLAPKPVLVAAGDGNAGLRAAAAALDVAVVDQSQALGAVGDRLVPRAPDRREKAADAKHDKRPVEPSPPAKASRPTLAEYVGRVRALLTGDGEVTVDALEPLVAPIKRIRDVLDLGDELLSNDAAERLEALVVAIHRTAPPHVRLLQATTLLLRGAAKPGQESLADLLTTGETAGRLGGAGVERVISAATALQHAGYHLDRVLRGATRRERREHPAIEVLADHLDGLWRLVVTKDGVRGEVWVAETLPPEGQAGLPQLALRPGNRVALVGDELAPAWSEVGGPTVVALESLVEQVQGWTST